MKDKGLFTIHGQCPSCWCPGDAGSILHEISASYDTQFPNKLSLLGISIKSNALEILQHWRYCSLALSHRNTNYGIAGIYILVISRHMQWCCHSGSTTSSLVAYGSGKRMVTGTRAGSRIKTRNFKPRFLPHHKSQRHDIWCTNSPAVSCFNPKFVDRCLPYEAKQRRVKFRRCFGNIPSEFR